ncbi:unnamed protein product [Aphanomyces euteiches]|uniref:Peptidase n=1 Tax=Aphanomyces euteiches TaxID=100861 RepID=A0A6G0XT50_9STRA|nr:hypothetical protein Ae201684_001359 [Aphanomyces euteiches]KAH9075180.1 hypothetical protein Ae201684P_003864 [Aphanomyces euteiches]KAH9141039.1 hypothetical protein AeRB84_014767 [Aphanomyces euteiches]
MFGHLGRLLAVTATVTLVATAEFHESDRCTVILVGAKASTSGSPMTTHTADCTTCDFRLVKVPQLQHTPGSMRSIPLLSQVYPRYVGRERGAPEYYRENLQQGFYNWSDTPIIGQIPQVEMTYGYLDGIYPVLNEHQLAIGESTCPARFWAKPATQGGQALFDITELARVAFERTKTARDAIKLMGSLAEQYGYYGAEWEGSEEELLIESGETLTVTDTKEGWVFHILPDDTGASAIWVAQRVPDNHIAAIGNQFIIHHVNLTDSANFLGSANLYDIAKKHNFWDGESPFDFTAVYAHRRHGDSYYYSTRRQWRIFTLANPNLTLSPYTDAFGTDYPFSVETDRVLDALDILRFQRDHYEKTPFDLTEGPQSGPYGNPDRYSVGENAFAPGMQGRGGFFERGISLYRTSYSYVTLANPWNATTAYIWFGHYAPHAAVYMPVYAHISSVPTLFSQGSLRKFDWNSSFWINALLGNYAGHFYIFAMPSVSTVQLALEKLAAHAQASVQAKAQSIFETQGKAAMVAYLTSSTNSLATAAHEASVSLFYDIVTRFHDGTIFGNFSKESMDVQAMGYPTWWLEEVGYFGPRSTGLSKLTWIVTSAAVVGISLAFGVWLGRRPVKTTGYALLS